MRYNEAVIRLSEIADQMQGHADAANRASFTYAAHMTLYNVATDAFDEKGMELNRDTLHTTLDIILDSGAMLSQLRKEQRRIATSVTDFPR